MPTHIRAFIVVIVIAILCFAFIAKPAKKIIPPADFNRWRNLWLAITATAFFVGNFWVLTLATIFFVLVAQKNEPTVPALYWLLLCVIPPAAHEVSGLGILNYFFELNMPRLLALVVLLPALLFATRKKNNRTSNSSGPDFLIILFFLLSAVLLFRGTTFTDALRDTAMMFLGMLLPYFAFSRRHFEFHDIQRTMLAFLLPMFILGVLGGFEAIKHWKLYVIPGISEQSHYLARVGTLRASTTTGGPIVFGYIMMIGIGFLLPFANRYLTRLQSLMAFGALGLGLLSSLSRGPWVGTVFLIIVYISTGRNAIKKLALLGFSGIMLLPFLALTPFWQKIVNLIPFIGTIESGNIDYRKRLFDQSWIVIKRNPLFGSTDYLATPEMQSMIQGQGIIDLVNTYIQISLETGMAGLFLFVSFFCLVLLKLRISYRSLPNEETNFRQIGRAIFATLVAVLVTIATVSNVSVIPYLYWSLAGLAMAYVRITREQLAETKTQTSAQTVSLAPQASANRF